MFYLKTDGILRPLFLLLFMNIRSIFCQELGIPLKQALNLNNHLISIESAPMMIQGLLCGGEEEEEEEELSGPCNSAPHLFLVLGGVCI